MVNYCKQIYNITEAKRILYQFDRICILMNVFDKAPQISHIIYEDAFYLNVVKFNVRTMGKRSFSYVFSLNNSCPPSPIKLILKGLFVAEKMDVHILSFAYFCEKQKEKYGLSNDITKFDYYLQRVILNSFYGPKISHTIQSAAKYANFMADAIYNGVKVSRSMIIQEQYSFLVLLLKGTKWETKGGII